VQHRSGALLLRRPATAPRSRDAHGVCGHDNVHDIVLVIEAAFEEPHAYAGVRLGEVVSDLHGKSARAMIAALIAGATSNRSSMRTACASSRPCSLRNEPYRDATVDYEAVSVRRNARRWIRALKRFG
jgi:hypothetical protein